MKFFSSVDIDFNTCYTKNQTERAKRKKVISMHINILVEVYVKELDKTYDVFVPINKTIHEISEMIYMSISRQSHGKYIVKNNSVIYDKENRNIENTNLTIEKLSLLNGLKLTLV